MRTDLPPLIPAPAHVDPLEGPGLDPTSAATYRLADDGAPARRVGDALTARGWRHDEGAQLTISARIDAGLAGGEESFEAVIGGEGIELIGASIAGCHAAAGLAAQLVRIATGPVPAVRVVDAPVYPWRGMSVDIARSFFGPATLRRIADVAALYRLNRFHLHLNDDQGWRLELACRPALTEFSGATASAGAQAGFLTAAEYRDFDRYCADLGLVLVPEIDVPGHSNGAQHALPELNPDGAPTAAYDGDDVGFSRLYLDLPTTEPFLRDVFAEVAELTSGPYLHVGGDEALTLGDEEYRALVTLALDAVRATGKLPVGWEEISPAVTGPGTIVQYWFPDKAQQVVDAARRGAKVILSPAGHAYLDMVYRAGDEGQAWAGPISVEHAADWVPAEFLADLGLPPEAIEGVEAAIWTEYIHTEPHLLGMIVPRLAGIAEVAWHGRAIGGPADLATRVASHRPAWQSLPLTAAFPPTAFPS